MNLKIIDQLLLFTEEVLIELTAEGIITYLSNNWEEKTGLPVNRFLNQQLFNYLLDDEAIDFKHFLNSSASSFSQKLQISIEHFQYNTEPLFCKVQNGEGLKIAGKLKFIPKQEQISPDTSFVNLQAKKYKSGDHIAKLSQVDFKNLQTKELISQFTNEVKLGFWEYYKSKQQFVWSTELFHIFDLPQNTPVNLDKIFSYCDEEFRDVLVSKFKLLLEDRVDFDLTVSINIGVDQKKWLRFIAKNNNSEQESDKVYGIIQDITNQIEILLEADKTRTQFQLIAKNASGLISTHFEDGTYKFVSPSAKHLTGYEAEELIGANPFDYVYKNDVDTYKNHVFKDLNPKEENVVLHRFIKKDKSLVWFETVTSPILVEEELIGHISYSRDVTEKRKNELALQKSEHRLKLVLDSGKMGIWEWMIPEDKWLLSNNMLQLLGISTEDFSGNEQVMLKSIHPEDTIVFLNSLKNAVKYKTKNWSITHRLVGNANKVVWLEWNGELFVDKNGHPEYFIGTASDVTTKKEYEREVRKLALVAKNTVNAVIITDKYGNVEWVNEGFEALLGYSLDDVSGYNPLEFIKGKETNLDILKQFELAIEQKKSFRSELFNYNKKGQKYWVELNLHPVFDNTGNLERFIFIQNDLSRYKEQEEEMIRHNDKLQKANEELDNFVYRVSHDLRAPISSSLGLLEVIEMEKEVEHGSKYLDLLRNSMIRMDSFIRDILNYSRNARMSINAETFNLIDLINETIEHYKFIHRDISLREIRDYENTLYISSDRLRLSIILSNLISNVYKFYNQHTDKPYLWLSAKEENNTIEVIIADNGIGIPKEFEVKVFDMFFRASNQGVGSGLGLYIAKETIEKIGGLISLKSVFEKGTTITLILPKNYRYGIKLLNN
ncbi:PAS domain-containing sensor histidine kinase [Chondrinema litorale]|uniref:PAS domain-containing sensor histidine kinase n=1 Tax=Chondrinema litorale TaxID=2994555 RepID=UPI002542BB54|nr:PAS domain S-box protein [Chondrinema litorale]UZR99318.1 PAS domain S-box protein [Chondrinema litorale]